jgi:hypothetical protein
VTIAIPIETITTKVTISIAIVSAIFFCVICIHIPGVAWTNRQVATFLLLRYRIKKIVLLARWMTTLLAFFPKFQGHDKSAFELV